MKNIFSENVQQNKMGNRSMCNRNDHHVFMLHSFDLVGILVSKHDKKIKKQKSMLEVWLEDKTIRYKLFCIQIVEIFKLYYLMEISSSFKGHFIII